MSNNLSELSGRKGLKTNLFEVLGIAAELAGSPSITTMGKPTVEFSMSKANILSRKDL